MEFIVGAVLWILANVVYADMRRRHETGFKRIAAFFIGWPGTLVGMLSVEEGSQPRVRSDDLDLRELVEAVRRDRLNRSDAPPVGPGREEPPARGSGGTNDDEER